MLDTDAVFVVEGVLDTDAVFVVEGVIDIDLVFVVEGVLDTDAVFVVEGVLDHFTEFEGDDEGEGVTIQGLHSHTEYTGYALPIWMGFVGSLLSSRINAICIDH